MIRFSLVSICAFLAISSAPVRAESPQVADEQGFRKTVSPFIERHCVECHGPDKQKGKLRLDTLPNDFSDPRTAELWSEVVNAVNGHEMPPEEEPQPDPEAAGVFADWLAAELGRAELAQRGSRTVLRRMNREEYNNTIRDLVGVDYQPAEGFPEDPSAGGFDNIGSVLTLSPLQIELYYDAAFEILDRALVDQPEAPPSILWRVKADPNSEKGQTELRVDGQRLITRAGDNKFDNGFVVMRKEAGSRTFSVRGDFNVPEEGEYIIRFRAASRVPDRAAVVESAKKLLGVRKAEQDAAHPNRKQYHQREFDNGLRHFEESPFYNYGPPRVQVIRNLGGTPTPIAEMDVPASETDPGIYEIRTRMNTERAGLTFSAAYEIPISLENRRIQGHDEFARPELLIDWVEIEGPHYPSWPPASHTQVLGTSTGGKNEVAEAREIISRFMHFAYRREVTASEVDSKLGLFTRLRSEESSFIEAIKPPLAAVLASTHFLFLVEPAAPEDDPRPLNSFELASRLSYFLWSSMPDAELFRDAQSDRLMDKDVLLAQIDRMLKDPKSRAFVSNFSGQWLGLREVGSNPPVRSLYPDYDRHFETSIVRESEAFFAEILDNDLDVRNFIKSDFVTINERLGRFYGIPDVKGDEMRRVPVPSGIPRGGVVTQASIHSITSNGTRTSPVMRGVWVLKTLLGSDPGLPVANVGEIPSDIPGIDKATVRQRLAIHRENPSCARCHNKIDPLGLSLENFNAAGQWREQEGHGHEGRINDNDPPIDASARMPDGSTFVGVAGLQEELLKSGDKFLTALSSQLHTYALGRELGFSDRPAVDLSVAAMKRDGRTLRALIRHIVTSPAFSTK